MDIFLIYTSIDKTKCPEADLYKISEQKIPLTIIACILFVSTFATLLLCGFNYVLVVLLALSIYNLIYVYKNLKQIDKILMTKSPKEQVKYNVHLFFFLLKELSIQMKKHGDSDENIEQCIKKYTLEFKSDLSLKNFKDINNKLIVNIESIIDKKYEIKDMDFMKFVKKDEKKWKDKLFPKIDEFIKEDKINIKANTRYSTVIDAEPDSVAKNLKLLGLSANTKNFDIISSRYYSLVKINHPDRSSDNDAGEKLMELNKAYNELKEYYKSNGNKIF